MTAIFKSLQQISTSYCSFEKDQVLTHKQLNSLANYANDQVRLTRVKLIGVGLACGLRVAWDEPAHTVSLSVGLGITTDGDLVHIDHKATYKHFKPYDQSRPTYPPLYTNGDVTQAMLKAYELVRGDEIDDEAKALTQFDAETDQTLDKMVAVLLVESYIRDDDLCSDTDCDNLGKEYLNTLRFLLVHQSQVSSLQAGIPTLHSLYAGLSEVQIERPTLSSDLKSSTALVEAYRTVCDTGQKDLTQHLSALFKVATPFFDTDLPSAEGDWTGRLDGIAAQFTAGEGQRIQYYYDFLKDLTDTCSALRENLFEDTTWLHTSIDHFPKHLLLGNLKPNGNPDANRTAFYPSPVLEMPEKRRDHIAFLIRKLTDMLASFSTSNTTAIRITPSAFEDQPLEERAIPVYYSPRDTGRSIQRSWSYRKHQRNASDTILSYHASKYSNKPGVEQPLDVQMGRFAFFRVEGHIGHSVEAALETIQGQIEAKRLPFAVKALFIGEDKARVKVKPRPSYTDLHRFHDLLRRDIVHRLNDVQGFSNNLKDKLKDLEFPPPRPGDIDFSLNAFVEGRSSDIASKASILNDKLNKSYHDYARDETAKTWGNDVGDLLKTAAEYKYTVGPVVKTEFNTPLDNLLGSSHLKWLGWVDGLLDQKSDTLEGKMLLCEFLKTHPSIEHFAGVLRGGTFLLIYDESATVIADFMLPYICCEPDEAPVEEPTPVDPPEPEPIPVPIPLPMPPRWPPRPRWPDPILPDPFPPDWKGFGDGIRITKHPEIFMDEKIKDFEDRFKEDFGERFKVEFGEQFGEDYILKNDKLKEDFAKELDALVEVERTRLEEHFKGIIEGQLDTYTRDFKTNIDKVLADRVESEATRMETDLEGHIKTRFETEKRKFESDFQTEKQRLKTEFEDDLGHKLSVEASRIEAGLKHSIDSTLTAEKATLNANLNKEIETRFKAENKSLKEEFDEKVNEKFDNRDKQFGTYQEAINAMTRVLSSKVGGEVKKPRRESLLSVMTEEIALNRRKRELLEESDDRTPNIDVEIEDENRRSMELIARHARHLATRKENIATGTEGADVLKEMRNALEVLPDNMKDELKNTLADISREAEGPLKRAFRDLSRR